MSSEVIVKPNTTLLRLVATHADAFYKQEWFFDQEFANDPAAVGNLRCNKKSMYTAVEYALFYLREVQPICSDLEDHYIWTTSYDNNDDRIYVGMWGATGFQVHRHLTINPKLFLNTP